jgi:hypothetical protein
MMRRLLFMLVLLVPALALAQFRTIPKDAKRGEIRCLGQMEVEIDGRKMRLSPGAQIRDAGNLVVLPTALPAGGARIKYLLDGQNIEHRVWILSPQEIAQPDAR